MIDSTFHTGNRNALSRELEGGIVVVTAYAALQRSNDSAHKFTQESNFWYLCGINEPDWKLIIEYSTGSSWLVAPSLSEIQRVFEGGLSASEAIAISGVTKVLTQDESTALLNQLAKKHTVVNTVGTPPYAEHFNFSLNPAILQNYRMLERTFQNVQDCRLNIAKLRAIKQPVELNCMQKAIDVTMSAFEVISNSMGTFKSESQIEAEITYQIRKKGADGHAYDPIIAAGGHACTLHYSKNSANIPKRQLVLMDVGAEYNHYAADITRTYIKGDPTKRQMQVHLAVEKAHHEIISLLEPMLSVEHYQRSADSIMTQALAEINLPTDEASLRHYFPHAISHGLGIDVHDSLGAPKYFQENMVLTVEPGIYIPEEKIGVRIEDDILITKNGHKNLSGSLSTGL